MRDLREQAKKYDAKLQKIKICLLDVDGILTDGKLYYFGEELGWNRSFHARDGYGMLILQRAGIPVGIITGGNSLSVKERFLKNLPLDPKYIFMGDEDKRHAFEQVMQMGFKAEEILYMGDEFFDIPLLRASGFSATVPGVSPEVAEAVDYITETPSGEGCAREVLDILRLAKGITPTIEDFDPTLARK